MQLSFKGFYGSNVGLFLFESAIYVLLSESKEDSLFINLFFLNIEFFFS